MSNDKVYVGAKNVEILVNMQQPLTNFTATKFVVRTPGGVEVEWVALVFSDTFLRYFTVSGDLDDAGTYYGQPYGQLGDWTGLGKTFSFRIHNKWR